MNKPKYNLTDLVRKDFRLLVNYVNKVSRKITNYYIENNKVL